MSLAPKPSWMIRRLAFLGDSSYSLYLLHIMLLDCFFLIKGPELDAGSINPLTLALLFTMICTFIAHLAYKYIERRLTIATRKIMRA